CARVWRPCLLLCCRCGGCGDLRSFPTRRSSDLFDRAAAEVELDRLKADEERLVERMRALDIARAENDRRRRELETGISAEGAALRKLSAETEARELARRWVVLKLAAGLLSSSMEAYRERQADPVMKRAGELFADL